MGAGVVAMYLVAATVLIAGPSDLQPSAASLWHEALAAHEKGETRLALDRLFAAHALAPEVLALDDRGLLDAAELHLRGRVGAVVDDVGAWSSLADVLRLRGRPDEAAVAYERLLTLPAPPAVVAKARRALVDIDVEVRARQAAAAEIRPPSPGSSERHREVEALERQVDGLLRANAELRRRIDEHHGRAVDARIAARELERRIADRREEYREYRENYQLFYRGRR